MVLDYRAPKDSVEYRNALAFMWGECFVDGVKLDRVCYVDDEAGVAHVYAMREWVGDDGVARRGPYLYRPSMLHPRLLDREDIPTIPFESGLPAGVAYYQLVSPEWGEAVRVRHYGRIEIRPSRARSSA